MATSKIIKYEGDNKTFIWKHPCTDFSTENSIVVYDSQEAIFFVNGQAVETLSAGKHVLEAEKVPFLKRLFHLTSEKASQFHCDLYFINKTVQMSLKWGTDSKVRFIDPNYGIPLEIGASGEMNLAVSDSSKLLNKLIGTEKGICWENESDGYVKSLQNCFRPLISTTVKTHLSNAIKSNNINLFEIDENLEKLSESLRLSMLPGFEEYGLTIPQLYITNILLPEDDQNFKKMKELHAVSLQTKMVQADALIKSMQADAEAGVVAARRKAELERQTTATEIAKREAERDLIRAQASAEAKKLDGFADAEIMRAKGYNQKDVIDAEVQAAYAQGIGNMTINSTAASDKIGMTIVGAVSPKIDEALNEKSESCIKCPKCGKELPANAKFCLECGEKV